MKSVENTERQSPQNIQTTIKDEKKKSKRMGKKNVIFIMTDDLRPSLSVYNVPGVRTPNFERLGKLSTTFSRAYNQGKVLICIYRWIQLYVFLHLWGEIE